MFSLYGLVQGSSLRWIPKQVGLVALEMCCIVGGGGGGGGGGGLSMVFLQLKDPLELFVKRREFLPCSGFLSRCNMT